MPVVLGDHVLCQQINPDQVGTDEHPCNLVKCTNLHAKSSKLPASLTLQNAPGTNFGLPVVPQPDDEVATGMLTAEIPVKYASIAVPYTLNLAADGVNSATSFFPVIQVMTQLSSPDSRLQISAFGTIRLHNASVETRIKVQSGYKGVSEGYESTVYVAYASFRESPSANPNLDFGDPGDCVLTYSPNLVVSPAKLFTNVDVASQTSGQVFVTVEIRRMSGYYAEWNWTDSPATASSNSLLTLTELRQVKVMT